MNRRTYESPMDWEYQDSGPFDPTSPFTHAAQAKPQHAFGTPSKPQSRPNPFANLGTPSKQQAPAPNTSFATPFSSKNIAPAFRNPAFTTPRKPFDEVALSEASGPEDSPALTEFSDLPNDTPEADRMSDVNMSGIAASSRVNKNQRYNKHGLSSKKHAPGRGEIRSARDHSVGDGIRKRKRHNYDRDVTGLARYGLRDSDDSDADSDASFVARRGNRSRGRRTRRSQPQGQFGSLLHMLDEHPNAPENLYRWIKLMLNAALMGGIAWVVWGMVSTVRSDIYNANEAARMELMSKMTECQNQYTMNECSRKDRPALRLMCEEWYDCMMQNPESIMRIKTTAKQVAEILNEFADAMNLKAWGFSLALLFGMMLANSYIFGPAAAHRAPTPAAPPQPSAMAHDPAMPPENGAGFMWVPVQTPQTRRHHLMEDGTDTDASPPKMKPLLPAAMTPSGRRSPVKGARSKSPVKAFRTPSKGY